jgi:hypothetical protein
MIRADHKNSLSGAPVQRHYGQPDRKVFLNVQGLGTGSDAVYRASLEHAQKFPLPVAILTRAAYHDLVTPPVQIHFGIVDEFAEKGMGNVRDNDVYQGIPEFPEIPGKLVGGEVQFRNG